MALSRVLIAVKTYPTLSNKYDDDIERTLMIEDWEIGQLFWNCLKNTKGMK